MGRRLILPLLAGALLCGCNSQNIGPPPPPYDAPRAAPAQTAPAPPAAPGAPAGTEGTVITGRLAFDLPEGWRQVPPASSMRLAQVEIPGEAGAGELAVFFFGEGGGGGVEANLSRWIGQIDPDPGTAPTRDTLATGPFTVTWVDVTGTLKPSTMGVGSTTPRPDSRLLGAVVEGPGGPWFLKVTGPHATLSPQYDAFLALLRSVRNPDA